MNVSRECQSAEGGCSMNCTGVVSVSGDAVLIRAGGLAMCVLAGAGALSSKLWVRGM